MTKRGAEPPASSIALQLVAMLVSVMVAMFYLGAVFRDFSAEDVRAACASHNGVRQVELNPHWWSGFDAAAVVVCRDGYVKGVR